MINKHTRNRKDTKYNLWWLEKKFDSDAEVQSQMMRNTIVGKVDNNTAMISTEIFNPEMIAQFMSSDEFKQMEQSLGLSHEVYKLTKTWYNK